MPKYFFTLDGKSSLDYSIQLQAPIQFPVASKKYDSFEVPGRNGSLHVDTGKYSEIEATAKCFVLGENAGAKMRSAVMWLMQRTTRRLETKEDPDAFRLCRVLSGYDTEVRMGALSVFDVTFLSGPERWIKTGETSVDVASGQTLTNDWMPSLPLIRITGSGSGELVVGGSTIAIDNMGDGITIDCDTQNAYNDAENKNGSIKVAGGFPVLKTGDTMVTYSGGITAVQITPRWWTL